MRLIALVSGARPLGSVFYSPAADYDEFITSKIYMIRAKNEKKSPRGIRISLENFAQEGSGWQIYQKL